MIVFLRLLRSRNIALRAMALARGKRQQFTTTAFAACINVKHLNG
ncbi:hypothetical protein [Moorena sp. SIOASIH]|nr:hypothetical protein [Moorena sp. SIOASIH]